MTSALEIAWDRIVKMATDLVAQLPNLVLALIILFIAFAGSRVVTRYVGKVMLRSGRSRNATTVVELLTRWGVLTLGALIALSIALPSFAPADLIQILGIGGVAIGFAFRDIFENFLAGLIILLTDAFKIGDQIVVNDLEGTVENIQTRATIIRTYNGREIIVPNAELFTNAVTVNTSRSKRRSEYDVGISYASDIDTAIEVVREAISNVEGVLPDPEPEVLVADLAGSSVNLRARWWTEAEQKEVTKAESAVIRATKYALDRHNIEIPFPIRTIYVQHASDENLDPAAMAA